MNGNALVNQGDVQQFVTALLNNTYDACADVSADGVDNGRDVRPFVVRVIALTSCTGACCVSGGNCIATSQPSCNQQSGVYQGNGSLCSPNPCPQIGACCITGSCIFLSGPNCTAQGGTFQGIGTLCSPNPCPQVGACCITGTCTILTMPACGIQGGAYLGNATVCTPNPCGACCVAGNCIPTSQPACTTQNGTFQPGIPCTPNPCPQSGACCLTTGGCMVLTLIDCMLQGGVFQTIGSACTPNPCPPAGACCIGSVCNQFTQAACTQFGGTYQGNNSPCTPDPCLIPGACCMPNGDCNVIGAQACANAGGIYRGDNSVCNPNPCTGACCLAGAVCQIADMNTCTGLGGSFQGVDSVCVPNPCPFCAALPAAPDTQANGPHGVGRIADINLPNSVVGGAGGQFPEIPSVTLQRDGRDDSPFVVTGKDAVAGFDVRGQVRYPAAGAGGLDAAVAGGGPFPLIVIAHGNHNRFTPASGDPSDENYRGYTYLQDYLATRGYISVSIDEDDFTLLDPGILSRAWLVLCHAENMRRINAQAGHVLQGSIDMSRIAFMGHSRGGEAVVKAMQMNAITGGAEGGPGFGAGGADDVVFSLKAVWGLASTRFFDGAFNFDFTAPIQAVVPASNIVGGTVLVPFMGMWGDADGDIGGANIATSTGVVLVRNFHVEGTYDGSDPDPKQFVWIEGANHNFWNTSWFGFGFGDDGITKIPPPQRITPAQQQDLARGYGLAFFESYVRAQAPFQVFFKRPANERPAAPIAATKVHLQYQPRPVQRSIVDDFEANPVVGTTSRGTPGVDTGTLVGPGEFPLNGADEAGVDTQSFFHNSRGVLFEWNAFTDFYETVVTDVNVAAFENLSFRAALDRRGPGATPALDLRVTLRDSGLRTASIQTASVALIPVAQLRSDTALLTKSMLKTLRIPLCRFKDVTPNLDLTNITHIRFEFDRAAGKMALDDIEFSN